MSDDWKLRAKLFLALLVIVTTASLALFYTFENVFIRATIVISALLIVGLALRLSLVFGISDNKVRLVVLTSSLALLFGVLQLQHSFDWLYKPVMAELFRYLHFSVPSDLLEDNSSFYWISAVIITAWIAIVFLVMRRLGAGSPAMGSPNSPLHDVLPNISNLNRLQLLKRTLRDRLDHIDFATRWNEANFVSLQAEVQILEGRSSKRKVVDLISALRLNPKTRLFLVLGEPGTGKSVALRKLTRDLLWESSISDRIPVYLNLKEWKTPDDWSPNNRPTTQQFHEFVYNSLLQSVDFSSQAFLSAENYSALLESGYLFFILDSFDEIPAVLDHDENSWIIDDLSEVISRYVLSGTGSRGIMASRLFRQPKIIVKERSVFEIQPFTDDRIVRAIKLACVSPEHLIRIVLTERNDLGTIARNPFLLHLIINHYNQKGTSPSSQAEMFESFIDLNLKQAKAAYGLDGLSETEIYEVCERIAAAMFVETRAALEIGEPELRNEVDLPQLPYVLRFLAQARLARVAPVSGSFSFSHRRFNEYFLVRKLSSRRTEIPFDAIQADSRWRDALVLYAEIADNEMAQRLAEHAWRFACNLQQDHSKLGRQHFVEARHALRFLVEGFRNRSDIIEPYQADLENMTREKLSSECDYIEKKTVLEGIALLPSAAASRLIAQSLNRYPGWISEESAASARYLKRVPPMLARAFYRHCVNRPFLEPIAEAARQARILRISSAFDSVTAQLRWYLVDVTKSWICGSALLLTPFVVRDQFWRNAVVTLLVTIPLLLLLLYALTYLSSQESDRHKWLIPSFLRMRKRRTLRRPWQDISLLPKLYAGSIPFFIGASYFATMIPSPDACRCEKALHFQEAPVSVTLAMCILAICTLVPLQPTVWSDFIRGRWRMSRFLPPLLSLGLTFLIFGVVMFAVPSWMQWYLAVAMAILGAGSMLITFLQPARAFLSDWLVLRRLQRKFVPSRSVIADQLAKLSSTWGRLRYIRWVEDMSMDHLQAFRQEDNLWPGGRRPQRDGDEATILLAQVDMRWLDLS